MIPAESGDLSDYLRSLERLLAEEPGAIYPAHGPKVADGPAKIRNYIEHRAKREREILDALAEGRFLISEIVAVMYAESTGGSFR